MRAKVGIENARRFDTGVSGFVANLLIVHFPLA
jgi:hypothetical protein